MAAHLLRHATLLVGLAIAGLFLPRVATAQGACEAMPSGPARTDCFIGLARIANQKSNLARDKARLQGSAARARAATGKSVIQSRELCRGKGAGTRACYRCCRAHG